MSQYSKGSFYLATAYITFMACQIVNANASDVPSATNVNNIVAMTNQNNQGAGQSIAVKIASKLKNQFDRKATNTANPVAKKTASIKAGAKVTAQSNKKPTMQYAAKRELPQKTKSIHTSKSVADSTAAKVANQAVEATKPTLQASSQKKVERISQNSDITRVASYYKSSIGDKPAQVSDQKLKIYQSPDQKSKIVTSISVTDNFSVKQGDWVRVKNATGQEGWALISDVEKNINEAWNAEFQVIINGPSSNYSVSKVSPEERKQRQQKLRQAQVERMQKLAKLWESEFFSFNDELADKQGDQIKDLQNQVVALNKQLKSLQNKEDATQAKV